MAQANKTIRLLSLFAAMTLGCNNPPATPPTLTSATAPLGVADDVSALPGAVAVLQGAICRFDGERRRINAAAYDPYSRPGRGCTTGQVFDEDPVSPARSQFNWPLPHRQLVREARLEDNVALGLGTLYVVDLWCMRVYFGLTRSDELVHLRTEGLLDDGEHVWPFEPVHPRYGRQVAEHFGDLAWVRAALSGDDPVLRLHLLDVLGGELLPLTETLRWTEFEQWHTACVAVRADPVVQCHVRASLNDAIPWIADAARRAVDQTN